MKLLSSVIVAFVPLLVPLVAARFLADNGPLLILLDPALPPPIVLSSSSSENFLVELAPGETRWVTESEKWRLRRHGQRFMDITNAQDLGALAAATATRSPAIFPANLTKQDQVRELIEKLSKTNMQANLEQMTSFYTRYYKSDYGRQSSEWLLQTIVSAIAQSGADQHGTLAVPFPHNWVQSSIIATIPGRSNRTIVVGAHQDSINLWVPDVLPAPGADDDGSGTVTILEAFIALLRSDDIIHGHAENTIEFHFFSAEEGGLLGSQDIFKRYQAEGRDVRAMLQQDMTGFVLKTREAGLPESVAVVTDFVDPQLVAFTKLVIEEYCTIPWVETKCGYACSDHASASKAGYPAASAIEAQFALINNHAHTNQDQIKYLSFDHMLQHSVLTTAFVYELAFTDFDKIERDRSSTAAAAAGPSMDL